MKLPRATALLLLSACRSPAVSEQPPAPTPTVATASASPVASAIAPPAASASPSTPSPDAADRRFIADASQAEHFFLKGSRAGQTFFTPTAADVAAFEAALTPALRAKAPTARFDPKPLADRWTTYSRQYVGHIEPDGSRWIWGNFFCRHGDGDAWKKHAIAVKDGGDCYFQADYSPSTHTLKDLSINGDA